jgi:hypothetical protein
MNHSTGSVERELNMNNIIAPWILGLCILLITGPVRGEVILNVSPDGQLRVTGDADLELNGYNLMSSGGHLIPGPDGSSGPFEFYLLNSTHQVAAGSLEQIVGLSRGILLAARYDPSRRDLQFEVGTADGTCGTTTCPATHPLSGRLSVSYPGLLRAGDADQDLDFDQLDLVRVQVAGKYRTGLAATWGEGDWDGAPGGRPGDPPSGNGRFDQLDIVAAQQAALYLTGPYAAATPWDATGSRQTSVAYHATTGELPVRVPEPRSAFLLIVGAVVARIACRGPNPTRRNH